MAKKLIGFDIDDTLVKSKNPLTSEMAQLLVDLLDKYQVMITSGSKYEIFIENVIKPLEALESVNFEALHLLPTCGTRYYVFNSKAAEWDLIYAEDLTEDEKQKIISVAEAAAKESGLWPEKPYGEVIEDRLSLIGMSLMGQEAPAEVKYQWFHDNGQAAIELRNKMAPQLPEFEVRNGGTTTIDITKKGVDKAFGMERLLKHLGMTNQDVLYIGDRLEEGGNDYPIKAMGIDTIEVGGFAETPAVVREILESAS